MNDKISMGYGGVEFTEKGYNLMTTPQPLKSEYGIQIEPVKSKQQQLTNIGYMQGFLDEVLFEQLYVEPLQLGGDGAISKTMFVVNSKYFIDVVMDNEENMYPILVFDNNGDMQILKFSYEGEHLEKFFDEIRKDIKKILKDSL